MGTVGRTLHMQVLRFESVAEVARCLLSAFVSALVAYQLERESAEQHDEGPAAVAGVAEHCDSTLQLSANTVRFTSVCYR